MQHRHASAGGDGAGGVSRPAVRDYEAPGGDHTAKPVSGAVRVGAAGAVVAGPHLARELAFLRLHGRGGEEVVVALQVAALVHEPRYAWAGERELENARSVLLPSAPAVFVPLTVTVFPVRRFQTSTLSVARGFVKYFALAS
jgi:hypothetical protein